MSSTHYVGWWNLENLFDEENAPPSRRTDKVRRAIGRDVAWWTPQLRSRKIAQLASATAQMNDGGGPDLLGICEVEDRFVIDHLIDAVRQHLPTHTYDVAHADTDDARGIDVAFIYDPTRLHVPAGETFFHVVTRGSGGGLCKIVRLQCRYHVLDSRTGQDVVALGDHAVPGHRTRDAVDITGDRRIDVLRQRAHATDHGAASPSRAKLAVACGPDASA